MSALVNIFVTNLMLMNYAKSCIRGNFLLCHDPQHLSLKGSFTAELCEMWLRHFSPECVLEVRRPSRHGFLEEDGQAPGSYSGIARRFARKDQLREGAGRKLLLCYFENVLVEKTFSESNYIVRIFSKSKIHP